MIPITNGLDPEIFVCDKSGMLVPAELFLKNPSTTEEEVVFDNAAIELRPKPAGCLEVSLSFTHKLMLEAMQSLRQATFSKAVPRGTTFSLAPAERLHNKHQDLPGVQTFGCSSSLVVGDDFSPGIVTSKVGPGETPWRCAGFHIHKGFTDGTLKEKDVRTRQELLEFVVPRIHILDCTLGLIDVLMNTHAGFAEQSRLRRDLIGYGRAGEFRVAEDEFEQQNWDEYGVSRRLPPLHSWTRFEYRTLSPWPLSHPAWVWWVHAVSRRVFDQSDASVKNLLTHLPKRPLVTRAINSCNAHAAWPLWRQTCKALNFLSRNDRDCYTVLGSSDRNKISTMMQEKSLGYSAFLPGVSVYQTWLSEGKVGSPEHLRHRAMTRRNARRLLRNSPKFGRGYRFSSAKKYYSQVISKVGS